MTRHPHALLLGVAFCAAVGIGGPAFAQSNTAHAVLESADGEMAGSATFTQMPAGLLVEVDVIGLAPGAHGIHLHQTGACSPDFAAAGDHFAPNGNGHGFGATATPHAADLPNLVAGADGEASAHYLNPRVTLSEGDTALLDDDGAALVVHANPDSYGADAGAGDRVVCGVIEPEG